jgi:hypothetical protein
MLSAVRTMPTLMASDLKHITSPDRILFSSAYFGSLALTLFFAVGVSSGLAFHTRIVLHTIKAGSTDKHARESS